MSEFSNRRSLVLVGLAALNEVLNTIGHEGKTDHDMAAVIVDNEIGLRALFNDMLARMGQSADLILDA